MFTLVSPNGFASANVAVAHAAAHEARRQAAQLHAARITDRLYADGERGEWLIEYHQALVDAELERLANPDYYEVPVTIPAQVRRQYQEVECPF
jgi:hypothetical protein